MHRNILRLGFFLILPVLFFAGPQLPAQEEAAAEGGGFKNLKVFPPDIPKARLKGAMKSFTQQLGVECTHCHIKDEYDKDDKEPKEEARNMIRMMRHLGENAEEYFPEEGGQKLRCWTCHRGDAEVEEWVPPEDD